MGDYAGALQSIRDRLAANWQATRITYQNEKPAEPWPPTLVDADAPDMPRLAPFVHLEILSIDSQMRGAGVPGRQIWVYDGLILVHVFVSINSGSALANQHAVAIGEIFRAKIFYNYGDGCYVRTWAPRVDGGGDADHEKNYYRVSMSVPFEYWHRG